MKRFASHGVTFIVALMAGLAIGFGAAWRMTEPERVAFRDAQFFRVELEQKIVESDALIQKLGIVMDKLEESLGPLNLYVKLYGEDKAVVVGRLMLNPGKED